MRLLRARQPPRLWFAVLAGFAILCGVVVAAPTPRHALLRYAGWALVAEDAPAKADIIVIASDALGAGTLEAADLVHAGFASRVALFDRPPTRAMQELTRRGLRPLDPKTASLQHLHELGIDDVQLIPSVAGTVDEGNVLREWCAAHSIRSILFVSLPDHSRRTRRVLDRALGHHGIKVIVRYARFAEFDPDTWWQTRGGQRTQIIEAEKLLVDIITHPF